MLLTVQSPQAGIADVRGSLRKSALESLNPQVPIETSVKYWESYANCEAPVKPDKRLLHCEAKGPLELKKVHEILDTNYFTFRGQGTIKFPQLDVFLGGEYSRPETNEFKTKLNGLIVTKEYMFRGTAIFDFHKSDNKALVPQWLLTDGERQYKESSTREKFANGKVIERFHKTADNTVFEFNYPAKTVKLTWPNGLSHAGSFFYENDDLYLKINHGLIFVVKKDDPQPFANHDRFERTNRPKLANHDSGHLLDS